MPSEHVFCREHPTQVPIPTAKHMCEKKCCSVTMILSRVADALTIHKSQGMTCGEGETLTHCVLHMSEPGAKKPPGLEMVGISRAKDAMNIATGNESHELAETEFLKTGKSKANNDRRACQQQLRDRSEETKQPTIRDITALDLLDGTKTYKAGCDCL